MIEFTLDLYKNIQRPVIFLEEWHKLNVIVPDSQSHVRNLKIWDENGHLQVLCTSGQVD